MHSRISQRSLFLFLVFFYFMSFWARRLLSFLAFAQNHQNQLSSTCFPPRRREGQEASSGLPHLVWTRPRTRFSPPRSLRWTGHQGKCPPHQTRGCKKYVSDKDKTVTYCPVTLIRILLCFRSIHLLACCLQKAPARDSVASVEAKMRRHSYSWAGIDSWSGLQSHARAEPSLSTIQAHLLQYLRRAVPWKSCAWTVPKCLDMSSSLSLYLRSEYNEIRFTLKVNLAKVAGQIGHFTRLSPRWTEFWCRFLSTFHSNPWTSTL